MKKEFLFTLILFVSAMLGLLSSYEISIISGTLVFLEREFHMTVAVQSQIVSILILGALFAILFAGPILDRFGRKKGLLIAGLFYLVSSFISGFATSVGEIIIGRFLAGIGVGMASITVPLYLAEVSTPQVRGAMVSFYQLSVTIGILFSYLINLGLSVSENWRMAFLLGSIFAILGLAVLFVIPESPSWLVLRNKTDGAKAVLKALRPKEDANKKIADIQLETKREGKIGFENFFEKGLWWAFLFSGVLACFQQITGINSVIYYAPTIFQKMGVKDLSLSLLATVGIGIVNVIATVFALLWVDCFGRRKLLLLGLLGMAVSLFTFVIFYKNPVVVILSLLSYVVFFAVSLGPVAMVLIAEIFPLQIRGKAVSYGFFMIWLFNYIVTSLFLPLLELLTIRGVYGLYGILCVIGLAFVYFFAPETKGKTLEEIQQFWKK